MSTLGADERSQVKRPDLVSFYKELQYPDGERLSSSDCIDGLYTCGIYVDPFKCDLYEVAKEALKVANEIYPTGVSELVDIMLAIATYKRSADPRDGMLEFQDFIKTLPEGMIRERAVAYALVKYGLGKYERSLLAYQVGIDFESPTEFMWRYGKQYKDHMQPFFFHMADLGLPDQTRNELVSPYIPVGYSRRLDEDKSKVIAGHRVLIEAMGQEELFNLIEWMFNIEDRGRRIEYEGLEGCINRKDDRISALNIARYLGRRNFQIVRGDGGGVELQLLNS